MMYSSLGCSGRHPHFEPGHTIEDGDLRAAEVGLSPGVASVPAEDLRLVEGQVLAAPVEAGQVITPGAAW